jgi:hypothetical protein
MLVAVVLPWVLYHEFGTVLEFEAFLVAIAEVKGLEDMAPGEGLDFPLKKGNVDGLVM